ncbi:hypothetical protein FQA39_LY10213 [Lamprigera yunnana]|nr:hypothetical protein FQA39_LY10213 [Lamprigera yunnana]
MNEGESDINRNVVKAKCSDDTIGKNITGDKKNAPQRPNYLDIKPTDAETSGFNKIQLSERCFDLQKLLNADNLNVKPPRSPVVLKKFSGNSKNSPTNAEQSTKSPLESPDTLRKNLYHRSVDSGNCSASNSGTLPNGGGLRPPDSSGKRPETVETPTQTSDTLIGAGSVNLSLNVNCQMDLVQSPTVLKHTSALLVNPQMPWCQDSTTQRSYTSVNLTLRPPSTEPQPPIDITSQNSSLTYSTSSFDSQKGLQSRLQITVGPGGGSVSSFRTRPRSSYCVDGKLEETVPVRAESMPDLATNQTSPVIKRQQACIDRLRIELVTEKSRLVSMQNEVDNLMKPFSITFKVDAEVEKQLQKEIRHLRGQCERLTYDVDRQSESRVPLGETNEEFYRNIYTGQRGPLTLGSSERRQMQQEVRSFPQEIEGPKWNCHMCTFQNHPLLDKCEQCEMPRILHVSAAPGDNIHIHVTPRISRRKVYCFTLC